MNEISNPRWFSWIDKSTLLMLRKVDRQSQVFGCRCSKLLAQSVYMYVWQQRAMDRQSASSQPDHKHRRAQEKTPQSLSGRSQDTRRPPAPRTIIVRRTNTSHHAATTTGTSASTTTTTTTTRSASFALRIILPVAKDTNIIARLMGPGLPN